MVRQLVVSGVIKNYSACARNADVVRIVKTYLPSGATSAQASTALTQLCGPFYTAVQWDGNMPATTDTRKPQYAVAAAQSNRDFIEDTRNINLTPAQYWEKGRGVYNEFKTSTVVGVAGLPFYAYLETVVPWEDSSGGPIQQTLRRGTTSFERQSTGVGALATWTPWVRAL